jgi:hypothetical protein
MKLEIDVADFAAQLKAGKGIGGKDGALTEWHLLKLFRMTILSNFLSFYISRFH